MSDAAAETMLPQPPATAFDPAHEVPSEYENFCEGCGYSLVGIVADRCPECGRAYDPSELPFARVPWLHRRRIGRIKAYFATVAMVLFTPTRFARELARPVRISIRDARRFRLTTCRFALACYMVGFGTVLGLGAVDNFRMLLLWRLVVLLAVYVFSCVAVACFLSLLTDMPLFIWKNVPSLPPDQLAPVHHYASAPLALSPILTVVGVAGAVVFRFNPAESTAAIAGFTALICAGGILLAFLAVSLVLMKSITGCSAGRLVALALYLPFHAAVMFFLVLLGYGVSMMFVENLIRTWLRH
jgi:hypothetical protein